MYSTEQLPSLLSIQDILASEGPSTAKPRPPVPAPLVQTDSASLLGVSSSLPVLASSVAHSPSLYCELVRFVGGTTLDAWPMDTHPGGVTALCYRHLEGAAGHGAAIISHIHRVYSWRAGQVRKN